MQLITHLTHLRYLVGFTGSAGFLVLGKKKNWFFTDFRYRGIAEELEIKKEGRVPFKFVEMSEKWESVLKKELEKDPFVEFEAKHMTVESLKNWKKKFKGVNWSRSKNPIEDRRKCKDPQELAALHASQKINEAVLEKVEKLLKPGVTELEIAWKIKSIGHDLGADDISFEPIVAFGAHSAVPHHHNTDTKLTEKDLVLIDMGMKLDGYCSDMTRTFLSKQASQEEKNVYALVLESQEAGIAAIKSGVKCSAVDQVARDVMGKHSKDFGHSLGHGIGLDVHENPSLSGRSKDILEENMVVTVEPGIYLPGRFGVRIEDMGRVTQDGYENFTGAKK
jgi:Xaa-Pro aminopeptidase